MASATNAVLDEALNNIDTNSSEVSAIVGTFEKHLNEQKIQINIKDNINNNKNDTSIAISKSEITSNVQENSENSEFIVNNNNKSSFVNNNGGNKNKIVYQNNESGRVGQLQQVVTSQQFHTQIHHNSQNMPKSNEPIRIVYPINSSQHITSQSQTSVATMNSNQSANNRVTFTNQLPNGTINITSQPQIIHTVSASSIPSTTTIKSITTGAGNQQNQGTQGTTTQTLVIKNQTSGLVSSAPGIVTMTKSLNQASQQSIVGTPTMIPASVQIVGMRPGTPTQAQQKNVAGLAPRVVIGPHMVGTRPSSPAITLSALQAGQSGPALILKTENGYQLLRVGPPSGTPVTPNVSSSSGNQTIRLQTLPAVSRFPGPPLALRKTIVTPQHQSVATSATSIVVNSVTSSNATQILASQANASVQQSPTVASIAPVPTQNSIQQQQQHQVMQQQQQNVTSSSSGTIAQNAATQGNTKEKCRKFLANLIELSSREPKPVERNVRTLIQELIDSNVEPEEFCDRLERLLNASPQPCLIGFLKKSLPLLRHSLFTKELVIEGIKPPPQHVIGGMLGSTTLSTQLPKIQAQIRPIGQQTTTIGQTQVRVVSQPGTRPVQGTLGKQSIGGVRIQGPMQGGISTSGPRLLNTQIRPIGATANSIVQNNLQSSLQNIGGQQSMFNSSQNVVQIRQTPGHRQPTTVQIRSTNPSLRGSVSKNSGSGGITQVKVGQTQIKQISGHNTSLSMQSTNSNIGNNSNNNSLHQNSNKVISIKNQITQHISNKSTSKEKDKKLSGSASLPFFPQSSMSVSSSMYGDDDINDVAAMGGVNLAEESQRILGSTELIGTQIRSCKDEVFLHLPALQNRIRTLIAGKGLEEPSQDVAILISHACQERLKNIVEKLAVITEHRNDVLKGDPRYEVVQDVRGQLKFLEEVDRAEQKRHEEQEREMLMRAAKSRSKIEDPEQAKLKAKAKEMQRAEMEELRQRDANMTALQAIGPRKKPKLDTDATSSSTTTGNTGINSSGIQSSSLRPRIKRVNLRDLLFLMEREKEFCRSEFYYKACLK